MNKETNLDRIREWAKAILYIDIKETGTPFIASHPFTSSWFTMGENGKVMDLHDPEALQKWREELKQQIDEADLIQLFLHLNSPYILTFLKNTWMHMSADDLGTILNNFWRMQENISGDKNITATEIVTMFKTANKETLMDEEERERYAALPDMITVYRGVTDHNKGKKEAFSWTTDKKIAEWFANRFDTGTGEIWMLTVPKKRVLCAFGGEEKELIVNLYGFGGIKEMIIEKI